MAHHIPMFKFTLGPGQSIGPDALQALWADAARTRDVSVGRKAHDFGGSGDGRPTYSLYAGQHLQDIPAVEARLRRLLEEAHLRATLVPLHH